MVRTYELTIGGRTLTIEVGKLAGQANGAVTARYGDTVVLVTATANKEPREGVDFLPLTIDYEERLYAAGKIPGSWFRREGRPSTEAILAARLTDRPLRPLFPKGFRNDIQVIITVLSADRENDPDTLATIGASAALSISDIPFQGPVSSVRVGYIDGEYVLNPMFSQLQESSMDLVVAGTKDAIMMVEAGAAEVPEDIMLGAIEFGQRANVQIIELQEEIVRDVGRTKMEFTPQAPDEATVQAVADWLGGRFDQIMAAHEKGEREEILGDFRKAIVAELGERHEPAMVLQAFEAQFKQAVRNNILRKGVRPDGRGPAEIRPISAEVGLLPRTHGSGLFQRGQTQVLTIATLGSVGEEQRLDTLSPEETKRFLHHYNFPPFSVGEARRIGSPGRREIGHGALAERALEPVIPSVEEFPYTIRLVSEVLSSNGSTSMASVCGSTLSLMDAGVPIKSPVAGVAMGLVMGEDGNYQVLTDIAGIEDALGDMDFKVAGTEEGVTALQMDIKIKGITTEVMARALEQAREGRLFILGKMREAIAEPRTELSRFAPRMYRINIPVEKIGAVIGPGGRVIRSIIEETKATIDIEDDGTVFIGATSEESARRAIEIIEGLTKEAEVGQIYTGKVTRLMPFGAFVEILPGKEGLVHISELADYRVPSVEDVVKVGDEIMVMVTEIDHLGRINLSRRAVLEGTGPAEAAAPREREVRGPRVEGRRPGGPYAPRTGPGQGVREPTGRGPAGRGTPGIDRQDVVSRPRRRPRPQGRDFQGPPGPPPPPRPPFGGPRRGR